MTKRLSRRLFVYKGFTGAAAPSAGMAGISYRHPAGSGTDRANFGRAVFVFLVFLLPLQSLMAGANGTDSCAKKKISFSESLAWYVNGEIIEKRSDCSDGGKTDYSEILIPRYYGYHSFLGVLDSFVARHTSITHLQTWQLADRNFHVIHLRGENVYVKIIYDLRDSMLLLTTPAGY